MGDYLFEDIFAESPRNSPLFVPRQRGSDLPTRPSARRAMSCADDWATEYASEQGTWTEHDCAYRKSFGHCSKVAPYCAATCDICKPPPPLPKRSLGPFAQPTLVSVVTPTSAERHWCHPHHPNHRRNTISSESGVLRVVVAPAEAIQLTAHHHHRHHDNTMLNKPDLHKQAPRRNFDPYTPSD